MYIYIGTNSTKCKSGDFIISLYALRSNVWLLPGSILSAVSVFLILSYLFVPVTLTILTSLFMAILVLGLASSFAKGKSRTKSLDKEISQTNDHPVDSNGVQQVLPVFSIIVFVIFYIVALLVVGSLSKTVPEVFVSWDHINLLQIIQLGASVSLCFFLPGYAILSIIGLGDRWGTVGKALLSYILSIAITGFSSYAVSILGTPFSEGKKELIAVYWVVLLIFIIVRSLKLKSGRSIPNLQILKYRKKVTGEIRKNQTELLIFGSLFALIVLSTYYLYSGVIIGDQWFHHGRALSILAGAFKSEAADTFYPVFFHTVLAAFFSLSGVPSVNAYVSINFLNILPVLAFYYFFKKWILNPAWQKGAFLACTFFMLSSGFGWVEVLSISASGNPVTSQLSALQVFRMAEDKTLDIRNAGAFLVTSSPQMTTGLLLIGLPAGFLLLAVLRENITSKLNFLLVTIVTTVGILSHDEFYFFVITGALVPLFFKLPNKNSFYLAILSSIFIVMFVDFASPAQYYVARVIFGIPLILIISLFVAMIWALYASQNIIRKKLSLLIQHRDKPRSWHRFNYILGLVVIPTIAYLYIFTFLVWGQLSGEQVQSQSYHGYTWYLFPLKFGVTGLLAVAFILSYFYKKFEKEVFIFGLISIAALLLGPYYDEYRFNKYILVSLGALASILICQIINSIKNVRLKPALTSIIIGVIVTSSSLSAVMFNGYTASALQHPEFKEFHTNLHRRIFPTPQELSFLDYLRNQLLNSKTDHVTLASEFGGNDTELQEFNDQDLANKIQAFVGTSIESQPKFEKSPFTLNTSTPFGLYRLLTYTNSNYIIVPSAASNGSIQVPLHFALEHFQRVFQSKNYTVLKVPALAAPSSSTQGVALVYQPEGALITSAASEEKTLQFDKAYFKDIMESDLIKVQNQTGLFSVILDGRKSKTVWSDSLSLGAEINYIEGRFQIAESESSKASAGIVWEDEDKVYYVSITDKGLLLRSTSKTDENVEQIYLGKNEGVERDTSKWYGLKIVILDDKIRIYVDDLLKLQVPKQRVDSTNVSSVGIRASKSIGIFEPLRIGHVSFPNYLKNLYLRQYYPLSALVLSKTSFDTFRYDDFSVFSKKNVILPWDPLENESSYKRYLQFVKDGGTLYVFNPYENFSGGFSKLFSIKYGNMTEFDGIGQVNAGGPELVKVSGATRTIEPSLLNGTVISHYMNRNQSIVPFALNKKYGNNGGQIIFVNAGGYLNALARSPERLFSSLSTLSTLVNLKTGAHAREYIPVEEFPRTRLIGDMKSYGQTTINGSALLILGNDSNQFSTDAISILKQGQPIINYTVMNGTKTAIVKDLKISGGYRAIVRSDGLMYLPTYNSQYDYIGINLPERFDLRLVLDKGGAAEFNLFNSTSNNNHNNNSDFSSLTVRIDNGAQIEFRNMRSLASTMVVRNQTSLLLKSPEIITSGNMTMDSFFSPKLKDDIKNFNVTGKVIAKLDHVDNYLLNHKNVSTSQYITYFDWVRFNGHISYQNLALQIPGDLSDSAKRKGIGVPWQETLVSTNSIGVLVSVFVVASVLGWKFSKNKKIYP